MKVELKNNEKTMKIDAENSTSTNFLIIKNWSKHHFAQKEGAEHDWARTKKNNCVFDGEVINPHTNEYEKFHTPGQLITLIEKHYKKTEIKKRG